MNFSLRFHTCSSLCSNNHNLRFSEIICLVSSVWCLFKKAGVNSPFSYFSFNNTDLFFIISLVSFVNPLFHALLKTQICILLL